MKGYRGKNKIRANSIKIPPAYQEEIIMRQRLREVDYQEGLDYNSFIPVPPAKPSDRALAKVDAVPFNIWGIAAAVAAGIILLKLIT